MEILDVSIELKHNGIEIDLDFLDYSQYSRGDQSAFRAAIISEIAHDVYAHIIKNKKKYEKTAMEKIKDGT